MVRSWDGPVFVEAPRGYGKSLLAEHLGHAHSGDDGFVCVDGRALSEGFPDGLARGVAVVVDGVTETLSPDLLDSLCAGDRQVVITGRDLSHLTRWSAGRKVLRIGVAEMALNEADITALATDVLGATDGAVFGAVAQALTQGWPALVQALLADSDQPDSVQAGVPGERWDTGLHVTRLVDACVEGLDEPTLDAFSQLVHLPAFSRRCAVALAGPSGVARARADGLPVVERKDGWLVVARPVDTALRSRSGFRSLSAELLGPVLVASGGLIFAAKSLLAAGDAGVAADLLCSVPGYRFDDHNQAEVAGMIRSLDARLDPDPALSLLLARVHHNRAEIDRQRSALMEAERRALALDDERSCLEAQAELLFLDLSEDSDQDFAHKLEHLESRVGSDTMPSTRVRLREVRAMHLVQSPTLADTYSSITLFKDASYEWESLGEPERAAYTLRVFAASACLHLGRYPEALLSLDRAALLVEGKPTSLVKTLAMSARFAAMIGDRERFDSLISRVRGLLSSVSLNWINCFLTWAEMLMATAEADGPAIRSAHIQTSTLLGPLADHSTGVVFHAEAAIGFAHAGEPELAETSLRAAMSRSQEAPLEVEVARIVVAARVGDPEHAIKIANDFAQSPILPFERRWRIDLEVLVARSRVAASPPDSAELATVASRSQEQGLGTLFDNLSLAAGLECQATQSRTKMEMLGAFAVSSNEGRSLTPGHSTQLVKFLATAGGDVPVEIVIDVLWPEVDTEKGRKRLRNVINRTRTGLGPDSVLRNGDLVRLNPSIWTDLAKFRDLGGKALTGNESPDSRSAMAVDALNLYGGELLPDDVYSDWVDLHRQTASGTATGLLDLVIAHPTPDVVPSWLLETAGRIGARTEELWVAVAEFAFDRGAMECCRVAIHRAESAAVELGYEPSTATKKLLSNYR